MQLRHVARSCLGPFAALGRCARARIVRASPEHASSLATSLAQRMPARVESGQHRNLTTAGTNPDARERGERPTARACYSARSDSTGSSFDARRAGSTPAASPIIDASTMARTA